MNTSYGVDAYRSHELNIAMRTSSGDTIKMDFKNEQSSSMRHASDKNGSQSSMSFSTMDSFEFSIKSNGLDEQDKKEIAEFMKIAQPYIDNFLKNLSEDRPNSPVSKIAKDITSIFEPEKLTDEESKNTIKANIVKMFDNALREFKPKEPMTQEEMMEKLFEQTKKLLEKTLKEFDEFNKELYA